MKESEGEQRVAFTHSARPGEVSALHDALPHLAAEQANIHTLQILRGDLQKKQNIAGPLSFTVCRNREVRAVLSFIVCVL